MNNPIADTSFVLALANQRDRQHDDCISIFRQHRNILLPLTTINEVSYMIQRNSDSAHLSGFLAGLRKSKYELVAISLEDLERTSQLLKQYADTRLDFVDLSLVALSERLEIDTILTLDKRDFMIVRPTHCEYLNLLP